MHLQKAFIKALIFHYFYLERYIWIKTDVLGFAISRIFNQMTLDQSFSNYVIEKEENSSKSKNGQWHPMAFIPRKMIPVETCYKTHNQELLAIVEAFKT